MIEFPSMHDYKTAIKHGMIRNVDITSKDIINMLTLFGDNLGSLRGKTTDRKMQT